MKIRKEENTTSKEHDFQKALSMLPEEYKNSKMFDFLSQNKETIRFALRLADKLLNQEPSDGMWRSGMDLRNEGNDFDPDYDRVFKSMLTAAVTELEQSK